MPKRMTNEEFLQKVHDLHGDKFTVLDEYVKYQVGLRVKCNNCNKISIITPNNLLKSSHVCKFCGKNGLPVNRSTPYTTDEYISLAKKIHGDRFDYSQTIYINRQTKIIVGCPKHGFIEILPYIHLKFNGCTKCAYEESYEKHTLTSEDFLRRAREIHGDKYEYLEEYKGCSVPIKIKCKNCGSIFEQTPHKHINAKHGCPYCKTWKLEEEMKLFLERNGIEYIFQKRFDWLGLQSLDFFLPEYNIAIECQGKQHFKPSDLFGGAEEFLKTQERDKRKLNLCNEHSIKMLYFSDKKWNDEIFIDKDLLLKEILND